MTPTVVSPLVPPHYDYLGVNTAGATTDVYTYYIGGVIGVLQGTVTVTYTSVAKDIIQSVVRT